MAADSRASGRASGHASRSPRARAGASPGIFARARRSRRPAGAPPNAPPARALRRWRSGWGAALVPLPGRPAAPPGRARRRRRPGPRRGSRTLRCTDPADQDDRAAPSVTSAFAAADDVTASRSASAGERRRGSQADRYASTLDRDIDVILGPAGQRLAGGVARRSPGGKRQRSRLGRTVGERQRVAGGEQLQGEQPRQQQRRQGGDELDCGLPRFPIHRRAFPARPSRRPSARHSGKRRGIATRTETASPVAHLRPVPHRRRQRPPGRRLGALHRPAPPAPRLAPRPRPTREPLRRARSVPRPGPPAAGTGPRRPSRPTRSRPPCESCWRPGATHADRPRPERACGALKRKVL